MSLRQQNLGSIIKPGFNPLTAPTPTAYSYWLYAWGNGNTGQLGLGNLSNYSVTKQVGLLTNWSTIAVGGAFSVAIKTDGTLWVWGYNVYGQLGTNNRTNYSSPIQLGALTTWLSVACGYGHVVATKTDGTLWSWGANDYGQLGSGTTTNRSSPVQVGALTTWGSKLACGNHYSGAVKPDGTLWTWGRNQNGQLGIGVSGSTTAYRSSPTQVGALTNWSTPSCCQVSMATTKTDGTLWTWGNNAYGQLGLGNTTYYSSPKQVGLLTDWTTIFGASISGDHFASVKSNNTLWLWGRSQQGQLGFGNTTYKSSPSQLGNLTNWSTNGSLGSNQTLFVKTDGTMWAWGGNNNGKLGIGNTTAYSSPKQVGSSTAWYKVATGNDHTLAMGY